MGWAIVSPTEWITVEAGETPIVLRRPGMKAQGKIIREETHEDSCRRGLGGGQAADRRDDRPGGAEGRRGPDRGDGDRHLPYGRLHAVGARFRGQVPGDPRP